MQVRAGDLIKIPLHERSAALGQVVVVLGHGVILLAVFPATTANSDADLLDQLTKAPQLVVETMDVLLETGDWSIVGNAPVSDHIPIPVYAVPVGLRQDLYIQKVNGHLVRRATAAEVESLRPPVSFSPAHVEDAVRAANGLGEWAPDYDAMKADWNRSVHRVLDNEK